MALTTRLHNLSEWKPATSFNPLHGHEEKFLWEIQKVWDNQEFFWMIPIQDIQQTNIQVTEKNGKSRSHEPTDKYNPLTLRLSSVHAYEGKT